MSLWRLLVVACLALSLLALPAVPGVGVPPEFGSRTVTLDLTPGVARTVPVSETVAVAAHLRDGRDVEIRSRQVDGWLPWQPLQPAHDHLPDKDSPELTTTDPEVSEPVWAGRGPIQVRSSTAGSLTLDLVTADGDLGYDARVLPPGAADAASIWPPIVPRDRWDPRGDCEPTSPPRYGSGVRRIYIHHTAVFPDHAPEEGDDILRAMCRSHVEHRGFSDLAYHFVIDQYGVIYQGRKGGILRPVVGAHAQGFNQGSVGVALIGNFEIRGVRGAQARALDQLVAWLADLHGIDPGGVSTAVSTGGPSTRFAAGEEVSLSGIVAHRTTGKDTACPGDRLMAKIGGGQLVDRVGHILEHDYGWTSDQVVTASRPGGEGPRSVASHEPGPGVSDHRGGGADGHTHEERGGEADDGRPGDALGDVAGVLGQLLRRGAEAGAFGA